MSIPYRSPRLSTPTERLAFFAQRPLTRRLATKEAVGSLGTGLAKFLAIDPDSRSAGEEDAKAGRPPEPKAYDDLGYFIGYASAKKWRR